VKKVQGLLEEKETQKGTDRGSMCVFQQFMPIKSNNNRKMFIFFVGDEPY